MPSVHRNDVYPCWIIDLELRGCIVVCVNAESDLGAEVWVCVAAVVSQ